MALEKALRQQPQANNHKTGSNGRHAVKSEGLADMGNTLKITILKPKHSACTKVKLFILGQE